MFSGYVSECGCIHQIEKLQNAMRLHIDCSYMDLEKGESIAVDGVCLSVTDQMPGRFTCDVSPETVERTRMWHLQIGDALNLERSLRLNDRLNGHFVMGHVDQICRVTAKKILTGFVYVAFSGINEAANAFLVEKGSIAINGVSLTLNSVKENAFDVMLIPETLKKTNLESLSIGDAVNVEYDYFAKLMAKQISIYKKVNA